MLSNIRQAEAAFLELARLGFAPMNPVWSVYCGSARWQASDHQFDPVHRVVATANALPTGTTHEDWMGVDLPWVAVAHAVLRLPGESVGADTETAHADRLGIPVFDSIPDLLTWRTACG